jgi:hypothetical protein
MTTDDVEKLITECRQLGIVFSVSGAGFKCSAPAGVMTFELQKVLDTYRNEIRIWLLTEIEPTFEDIRIGFDTKQAVKVQEWPRDVAAAADFVMLLTPSDLPPTPFKLASYRTIVDGMTFLASLKADIQAGATGPRSLLGTLQDDVVALRRYLLGVDVMR